MKQLFITLIFLMISYVTYAQEVVSTEKGGKWNDTKTWLNGKIPVVNSNVIINGKVTVDEPIECLNIKISNIGLVEFIDSNDSLTAKVANLVIDDGKLIIGSKWNLTASQIEKSEIAKIENNGIITVEN